MKEVKGQVLIIAVIVIGFLTVYSLLLTSQLLRTSQVHRVEEFEENANWYAEAGLQKALYCLNNDDPESCGGSSGGTYEGEDEIILGGGTYSTIINGIDGGVEVLSMGEQSNQSHTIKATFVKTAESTALNFELAAFAGEEGAELSGAAHVDGDIYSNGDVKCSSSARLETNLTIGGDHTLEDCRIDGDVRASDIEDCTIRGDAYYQEIEDTNVHGIEYPGSPNPPEIEYVISDEMINSWKADAIAGGTINDNYKVESNVSLGPMRIDGNLEIETNRRLTLTGVVYVTGNIVIKSNGKVKLDESFATNSGVLLSDGNMEFNSSTDFEATSQGGLVMAISTSSSDPAIKVEGGSQQDNAVMLHAPNGMVELNGGSKVQGAMGARIKLNSGSRINFGSEPLTIEIISDMNEPSYWMMQPGSRR